MASLSWETQNINRESKIREIKRGRKSFWKWEEDQEMEGKE